MLFNALHSEQQSQLHNIIVICITFYLGASIWNNRGGETEQGDAPLKIVRALHISAWRLVVSPCCTGRVDAPGVCCDQSCGAVGSPLRPRQQWAGGRCHMGPGSTADPLPCTALTAALCRDAGLSLKLTQVFLCIYMYIYIHIYTYIIFFYFRPHTHFVKCFGCLLALSEGNEC